MEKHCNICKNMEFDGLSTEDNALPVYGIGAV
jgi:hypothetical protein